MDRAIRWMRRLAMAALLLGIVLHLRVHDTVPGLATVFYGLPLPVLTGGWLALVFLGGYRCVGRALCVVLALGCGYAWYSGSFQHHRPASILAGQREVKVLFWNLAHWRLPHEALEKLILEQKPDIAGFVETGLISGDPNPLVKQLPPGYQALKVEHGMSVIVRGGAQSVRVRKLPSTSKYVELALTVDGAVWRLFVVDGVSSPLRSREDVLKEVLAEARGHPRTFILGDFNTPRESAWLVPWRKDFCHSFDSAGNGWSETWPRQSPVALLSIDHLWSSRDLQPLIAEKFWRAESDHAAIMGTFRVGN